MKVLVTGVAGQLGHDVMNELNRRGIEGIGSDIASNYSGIDDGTAVATMRYIPIDITDSEAVEARIIFEQPDAVIHWMMIIVPRSRESTSGGLRILQRCVNSLIFP